MISSNFSLKLSILFKIFVIYLVICFKAYADNPKLGSDDAKIKIKVFSSLTCPHCASFHNKVVPEIKKNYVDSGKVQIIFIDFPLDQAAFNASKLLHCLDQKQKINFLDTVYENQHTWTNGSNIDEINSNLKAIVENLGISSGQFDKCLNRDTLYKRGKEWLTPEQREPKAKDK